MLMRDINELRQLFWGPWSDFHTVSHELDRLMEGSIGHRAPHGLPVNIFSGDDGTIVTADLPGLDPEHIDVNLENRTLTLKVKRDDEVVSEGSRVLRKGRAHGVFSRAVKLGFEPDAEGVEAKYNDGRLEIRVPRSEASKPRRINVSSPS